MKLLKELLSYLIIIIIVVLVRQYIVTPVKVDGSSMEPTLHNNEILILNKLTKNFKRQDIVVVKNNNIRLVKRIIGLPNEHLKYKNGVLYINNIETDDTFSIKTNDYDLKNIGMEIIPNNYYFIMGDNRTNSSDSRAIGLIPKEEIIGKINYRIFPFNKFGKISY